MKDTSQIDNPDYRPKALAISLVLYIGLLVALYFIKIIYEPIEDPIALGVDLNYGVDLVGYGDMQTLNKANASKNNYDVQPEAGKKELEEAVSKPEPTPPPKAVSVKSTPSEVITADEESKVTVKTAPKTTTKPVVKPIESPTKAKPADKPVDAAPKPKVEAPPKAPDRKVDQGSIFKKSGGGGTSGSNGTVGTKTGVGGNNNGDGKPGEVGDKGDPKGTLDGKSIYGNPGKGGGSSGAAVSISGWKNKGPLNIPKDNSSETGRIRFKVIVDDNGDVKSITVVETSVSPSVTNYYKNQITQKLKSNLIPEGDPPPTSSGTITINITRGV